MNDDTPARQRRAADGNRRARHAEPDAAFEHQPDETVELEEEIRQLEQALKREREERRRLQTLHEEELEREVASAEERWMERARTAIQERDTLALRTQQMEEQLDTIRIDVNRYIFWRD